ncbi:hypothetical protein SAMN04488034_101833 [Salinimicrobium catena]|uniref:Transposase IS200-like domain-containing protein n=1 Tax=Salinimicrobium catena TaxID=390640 RepID=A0A1H5JU73_9FLAO|nr:hypothetical protein SAMN04488140_101819 [Salinimicrobium catena]SEE55218.1 hypothetical protein SAMN04488034_101833 [Salinimicrobium catena]
MSTKYKATQPNTGYYVTLTTVGWVDVFTRPQQKDMLIKNLQFCQKEKGLEIYAYCIMSNHLEVQSWRGSAIRDDLKQHHKSGADLRFMTWISQMIRSTILHLIRELF